MPVSAKFAADFSSFQAAVQKAEVSLKSFETGAGSVEKALNRMTNGFTGVKVIQDASLLAKSVEAIGGASRLTEAEQRRVNATVSEALAKYQALGQTAPAHLHQLAQATAQVEKSTSLATQATDVLKSSFGQFTAANLATSAIQKLTGELTEFVSKGTKLGGLDTSFQRLSASAKVNSADMLKALQGGTRGLVANFDLIESANKAMLLGLPVTTESMGDLAKAATTLGKAMGLDATQSLNDLITALGRSSPLILDNLGLTVKVEEANQQYAASLGKTADQLTEAEKKTAFYEAAMSAAKRKTAELGEQTLTLGEIVESKWTQIENIVTGASSGINVGLGRAVSNGKNFTQFLEDAVKLGPGMALAMQQAGAELDKFVALRKQDVNLPAPKLPVPDPKALREAAKAYKELTEAAAELVDRGLKRESAEQLRAMQIELQRFPQLHAFVAEHRQQLLLTLPPTRAWAEANEQSTETMLRMVDAGMRLPAVTEKQIKQFTAMTESTRTLQSEIDGLAKAMTDLGQTTGSGLVNQLASTVNAFNVVAKAADSFKGGLDNLTSGGGLKSILGGFTGIVGGISGIVSAAQAAINIGKALFNIFDRDKGRDMVEDFAKSFGGFDAPGGLHDQLLRLGAEGERLWIKLTQGVGRNNKEQAAAAIDEVRRALEGLDKIARHIPSDINIDVGLTYHRTAPELEEVPEFAGGSGGFRNFGAGTLAMLHGTEAVIRPEDLAKMTGDTPAGTATDPALLAMLRRLPEMTAIAFRDALAQMR
jgi:hypothetical protein